MSWLAGVKALAWREWLILSRQRITLTLIVLVPLLQVLLYGTAIRPQAANVRVAISAPSVDEVNKIADKIGQQEGLILVRRSTVPGAAEADVRAHRADIAIEKPEQKSMANLFAKGGPARIVADDSNPSLTAAAIPRIEAAYWHELVARSDMAEAGPGIATVRLYNPKQIGAWTFLPGLIGVIVMISMTMLGSLSFARERESGRAEALAMLPGGRATLAAGKLLPWLLIGSAQGALVLLVNGALFDLPIAPSAWLLLLAIPVLALTHLALGALIALRVKSQMEALQAAVGFYLPSMLLSGFLYPFAALPVWAQHLGNLFPLTHFIRIAEGVTLRHDPAAILLDSLSPMILFIAFIAGIGILFGKNRSAL